MYQSLHLSPHYPGTEDIEELVEGGRLHNKHPFILGNGDKAVTKLLDEIFLPIAKQFKPDIIIMSGGYDSHHLDPLGGLRLTTNFYGNIIQKYQEIQPKLACNTRRWI